MARTSEEVRTAFERKGIAIAEWARQNGVSAVTVHHLLAGRTVGRRGQAHRAAVLLGLKDGEAIELPQDPDAKRAAIRSALAS